MAISYEGFYNGGVSALDPEYGNFIGYRMSAAQLGAPGSPQTANQLSEAVARIKEGVKAFEISMVMPDVAETIPTQHFKEMKALMKLTGVKPSVHGPILDAAGFTDKGWAGEEGRADNERRMFDAIERAYILDPKGNIPIVFHASNGAPGADWRPGDEKLKEDKFVMEKGTAINRETGAMIQVKREYKFRPDDPEHLDKNKVEGGPLGTLFTAEGSINSANRGEWENKLTEVAQMNKHAEELIGAAPIKLKAYENVYIEETPNGEKKFIGYDKEGKKHKINAPERGSEEWGAYEQIKKAGLFIENAELSFKGAFHQAYKYGTDRQRKELKTLAEDYSKKLESTNEQFWNPINRQYYLDEALKKIQDITEDRATIKNGEYVLLNGHKIRDKNYGTPQIYQETEAFAMDKAAETFGNLAKKSYDKFKDKAPVIAVENMMQGFAFSRAEDIKKLVEKSRENFVKQLIRDGKSEEQAEKIAKKHLGATWDVGHLNIMKKKGFTDKDIIEQTKIMTKDKSMVKHVHLTDNFGYADTHLAPGMGNVPFKKILEELEKTGRLDEIRKITEAGGFVQHMKKSPHPMTMAAFGSPIYGMKAGPYWNQAMEIQGAYFGGYGTINPQTHHSYFGAGFTTMPVELGGQMPGGQSRFGGTPMA